MTGLPRIYCRLNLRPLGRFQAEQSSGPKWFASQPDAQAFQPRLALATGSRPWLAANASRASRCFSTSHSCQREDLIKYRLGLKSSPRPKKSQRIYFPDDYASKQPRGTTRREPDQDVFDPKKIDELWPPEPEDWDNPTNYRLPYVQLARTPLPPKPPKDLPVYEHLTPRLRVLFCGSDEFSCQSLQALHDEMLRSEIADLDVPAGPQNIPRPGRIESIHVVVRPPKPRGRGLVTEPSPVHKLAESLGLPISIVDTFTGWNPPEHDLIIAVSFGLLVPSRVLKSSKYGGLNVHPSFLPDLHGAAPIEHAFLLGRRYTGVSVQTLHPTKFDGGRVLRVSQPVELVSRSASDPHPSPTAIANAAELHNVLAPMGAKILLQTLRLGLYIPAGLLYRAKKEGREHVLQEQRKKLEKYEQEVIRDEVLRPREMEMLPPTHRIVGALAAAAMDGEAPVPTILHAPSVEPDRAHRRLVPREPAPAPKLSKADYEVPWRAWVMNGQEKKSSEDKKAENGDQGLTVTGMGQNAKNEDQKLDFEDQEPENKNEKSLETEDSNPQTTAIDIERRARALDRLWTHVPPPLKKLAKMKKVLPDGGDTPRVRILFSGMDAVPCPPELQALLMAAPGPLGDAYRSNNSSAQTQTTIERPPLPDMRGLWTVTFKQVVRDIAKEIADEEAAKAEIKRIREEAVQQSREAKKAALAALEAKRIQTREEWQKLKWLQLKEQRREQRRLARAARDGSLARAAEQACEDFQAQGGVMQAQEAEQAREAEEEAQTTQREEEQQPTPTPPSPAEITPQKQPTEFFEVTLPYFVDPTDSSQAIVLPVGVSMQPEAAEAAMSCLRIEHALPSGGAIKAAASVLRPHARNLEKLRPEEQMAALRQVSWDVVFRH